MSAPGYMQKTPKATLFQSGAADNFLKNQPVTLGEIKSWIDQWNDTGTSVNALGIGAVLNEKNEITGEMTMVGNHAYLRTRKGVMTELKDSDRILFAQVAHFEPAPENTMKLTVSNEKELKRQIEASLPHNENEFYVVRVKGKFPELELRSMNTEGRTPATVDEAKSSPPPVTFKNMQDYELVGVLGSSLEGKSFEGLHLHAVDENHKNTAGHLMSFKCNPPQEVTVEVMPIGQWLLATREQAQRKPSFEEQLHKATPAARSGAELR